MESREIELYNSCVSKYTTHKKNDENMRETIAIALSIEDYKDIYSDDNFIEYGLSQLDCLLFNYSRIGVYNVIIQTSDSLKNFIEEFYNINGIIIQKYILINENEHLYHANIISKLLFENPKFKKLSESFLLLNFKCILDLSYERTKIITKKFCAS